jgi:hypothetical protein
LGHQARPIKKHRNGGANIREKRSNDSFTENGLMVTGGGRISEAQLQINHMVAKKNI